MADRSRYGSRAKNGDISPGGLAEIKREPEEEDDEESDTPPKPRFLAQALGLCPVGSVPPPRPSPQNPLQKLNARGMPARIRKKNKLFFDDNIVNAPPPRASPKRGPKLTPVKTPSKLMSTPISKKQKSPCKSPRAKVEKRESPERQERPEPRKSASPDRKTGQRIGMRLRNLLKLPKAHKWVCFEHFYSNIDRALLTGENDFRICLRETFPRLTDRNLTQVQWTKIRRIMGKPRRCSQAFFDEERRDLETKRHRIRIIQQRKMTFISWKDLPNEIPMQLVIGTKVSARLRKPQDGIFTGSILGVDTSNNTYRITFDRPGLDTHSVPDYEVLSNDPPDTMDLSVMYQKFKNRNMSFVGFPGLQGDRSYGDPLLGSGPNRIKYEDSVMGNYPVKFLESIIRINKILNAKKSRLVKLRDFNSEAEKRKSFDERMPDDFERKYASVIIDLERMNLDLQKYLNDVQAYCHDMAPDLCMAAMLAPSRLREKCRSDATDIVSKQETTNINEKSLDLVTDLTALLLQIKSLSDSEQNAYELKVLQGTMQQIKKKLEPTDQLVFQNCVEIPMQRIQSWLGTPNIGNTSGKRNAV